ncbi:NAD-dependent epimerase/dehydratase family protein [Frigoribacterium faeni]|uniref:NAD-dependent dehydratase n=1 Tax=Frigoribacterium faeni TaxID=145483 RepID=A0A7W3JFW1_9MICO|nr:NAD(P)-dependent oxidoreductase [Frigoribacterium faeni]MBA8812094.1 hypothetical protein [Frigoribacterium faeni]BFF13108.1 NAD(P)-dependent oxidoreductase [Microbacterium flavescens]GEK83830.1 NAD-dependent dehydratase [Frigoribacterium faeni]
MAEIVITGGAGRVAGFIRPGLAEHGHRVQLLDLVSPAEPLRSSERFRAVEATDVDALARAFVGADLVVHLASHATERPWPDIRDVNVESAYAVHEAAHRAGVRRVLAASSVHAAGYVPSDRAADDDVPAPRPDTFYGVSKVVLEALGSLYADRDGSTVVSARIMTCEQEPYDVRSLGTWLSPADAVRLVEAALATDLTGHHVVWGVSRNTRRPVSLAAGERIGYRPVDDAETFAPRFDDLPPLAADAPIGGDFTTGPLGTWW